MDLNNPILIKKEIEMKILLVTTILALTTITYAVTLEDLLTMGNTYKGQSCQHKYDCDYGETCVKEKNDPYGTGICIDL